MDAQSDASIGSIRFATIYPASLVGSMTRAMMLSESFFLITTPVFDYPDQVQAVTGTVAVFNTNNSDRAYVIHSGSKADSKSMALAASGKGVHHITTESSIHSEGQCGTFIVMPSASVRLVINSFFGRNGPN